MKSSDKTILIGIGVIAAIAVFWIMVLGPKRNEASDLSGQIDDLQAQVAQSEQESAASEQARTDFSHNYRRLIAIGNAVPADADTPSLLNEVQVISDQSDVAFRSIELSSAAGTETAPAAAPVPSTDPAVASEAAAALLPIGATVGSAGLPVMPYTLQFHGGFFKVGDFLGRLDSTVYTDKKSQEIQVDGRLLTIDGFSLTASPSGFPRLTANVAVTSYLAPAGGIAAGASPTGPAPVTTETAAAPTDTAVPTPAPTAAVGAN